MYLSVSIFWACAFEPSALGPTQNCLHWRPLKVLHFSPCITNACHVRVELPPPAHALTIHHKVKFSDGHACGSCGSCSSSLHHLKVELEVVAITLARWRSCTFGTLPPPPLGRPPKQLHEGPQKVTCFEVNWSNMVISEIAPGDNNCPRKLNISPEERPIQKQSSLQPSFLEGLVPGDIHKNNRISDESPPFWYHFEKSCHTSCLNF